MPQKSLERHIRHKHPEDHSFPISTSSRNDTTSLSGSEEIEPAGDTGHYESMDEVQEEGRVDRDVGLVGLFSLKRF
jgi:hypothetical protein